MPVQRSAPHPHQRDNPRYFLRRQMTIDGKFRLPDEEVPEAASWPNLFAYLDLGWIEVVDEAEDKGPTLGMSRPLKGIEEVVTSPEGWTVMKEESAPPPASHSDEVRSPILESGGIVGPAPKSSEKPATRGKKGEK